MTNCPTKEDETGKKIFLKVQYLGNKEVKSDGAKIEEDTGTQRGDLLLGPLFHWVSVDP